jgi:hypothetical protein
MRDSSSTRRGVLTAAGATLFAGCSGLDAFSDESRESVSSPRLPDVTEDGESEPIVVDAVPVEIERAALDERTRRVADLLGTLPMPFGPESVPNGHLRRKLVNAARDATASVEDARTAKSRLSTLQSLRRARAQARYAAAGWAFVESGLTDGELQVEYHQTVDEARALRTDHEYLGTDPVRAALVHARIERNLDAVIDGRSPARRVDSGTLLAVSEWGEHAEEATARVADSRYLYGQFESSLPGDAGTVEATLTAAAEDVADELRSRREELPAEPTDENRELVGRLRYRLRDAAESSAEGIAEADGPASAVLAATEGLADLSACERVRSRIEDGEQFRATDASDVRAARSQALEAIRAGLERSRRPELVRPVLADAAVTVAFADEELSRYRGDVRLSRLNEPIRRYTVATARARSTPTACQRILDALKS